MGPLKATTIGSVRNWGGKFGGCYHLNWAERIDYNEQFKCAGNDTALENPLQIYQGLARQWQQGCQHSV